MMQTVWVVVSENWDGCSVPELGFTDEALAMKCAAAMGLEHYPVAVDTRCEEVKEGLIPYVVLLDTRGGDPYARPEAHAKRGELVKLPNVYECYVWAKDEAEAEDKARGLWIAKTKSPSKPPEEAE